MILGGEIKDAKLIGYSSDFQTLTKHLNFYCVFFNELLMSLRNTYHAPSFLSTQHPQSYKQCIGAPFCIH